MDAQWREPFLITPRSIGLLASRGVGWPKYVTDLLGVPWPLRKDWTRPLMGREIEQDVVDRILAYNMATNAERKRLSRNPQPPLEGID